MKLFSLRGLVATAFSFCLLVTSALAQVSGQAFEGFRGNSDDPVKIDADRLEVLDGEAKAEFDGNVKVQQGTSVITTDKLVVHYVKDGSGGQNDIEKLELFGNVIATSDDNTASADEGLFIVATEDIVLTGNVVVSQGPNIAKGCKLVANLKTNVAKIESCGGRVSTVFQPGSTD
ncbi:MAG: hypothetical protein OXR62_05805 [Ahrensia sp.]|nr:hypothetical protein [Ahrensia sp.]